MLGLLEGWDIVATDDRGCFVDVPASLASPDDATLAQHGVWIRRWTVLLDKRLQHRTASSDEAPARPPADIGLDLLATIARPTTRPVMDVCLERIPHARRALDLGGGHGEYS